MTHHDPRLTLARPDLARAALEGVLPASAYGRVTGRSVLKDSAAIRRAPRADSEQQDQLLFGEVFEVLDTHGDFAWGQAKRSGYVGYVAQAALAPGVVPPSHRIHALRTYVFSEASIKSKPLLLLSLNALVMVEAEAGRFLKLATGGYIIAEHAADLSNPKSFATDPAQVAELYLHAPYQWGGRESLGLDCSGLVQQALWAAGQACPRDSDQQADLGVPVEPTEDLDGLCRNDLVFWKGHVAMMVDETRIIHANAHHMRVVIEPLAEAVARIIASGTGAPIAYRRLLHV